MTALRVLHADDDADIRAVVQMALRLDPGIATKSCASGQEALIAAVEWLPDIVVLDVMMPGMDGPSTLVHLRDNPQTSRIPVAFLTTFAQRHELDHFHSLGAAGVIFKPFDPHTLAASVRSYVCSPRKPRQLDSLRDVFLQRARNDAEMLSGNCAALQSGEASDADFVKIGAVAHGLAGAGGMFGFAAISNAASALEEAIINLEGVGLVEDVAQTLDNLLTCLHAASRPQEQRNNSTSVP